ncbi:MAG: LemA family protein [Clostridia bacterium]|nr:LemA family protein [Clostridia bacterium]
MTAIIVIFILACVISYIIIQIYNFMCLKNQFENYKSATYIYLRKKLDNMPKLINKIRGIVGETDEVIKIIKIRNEFDESQNINENMLLIHESNRLLGVIFNQNPNLLNDSEVMELKNDWYGIDASLRDSLSNYVSCAKNYNNMFSNIFCIPVIKIFKYEKEDV